MCVCVYVCISEKERDGESFRDRVYWVYVCVFIPQEEKWQFSLGYSAEQVVCILRVCVFAQTNTCTCSYVVANSHSFKTR